MVEHTQRSLRILFALLYGAELTWEHLATADSSSTLEKLRYLITAGAYAEYLGCLDHITAPVTAIIRSNLSFAYLIPENPQACLLFTKKFSLEAEFYDCTRHIVAQAFHNEGRLLAVRWETAAEWLDVDEDELKRFYKPQFWHQQMRRSRLKSSLYSLQIESISREEIDKDQTPHALFDWLVYKVNAWRGEEKAEEKAFFLARAIWGQWLAAHDGSAYAVTEGYTMEAAQYRYALLPILVALSLLS